MPASRTVLRVACTVACLASVLTLRDNLPQEFIEQQLRIPHPDRVLNSVLDRLQRNREGASASEEDCDDPKALPEYTESLEASRERDSRQLGPQKHYPICHMERKIRRLNTNDYEYRPAYYEEVRCAPRDQVNGLANEVCSTLGFSCVQWNKTIHLTRRRYTSDCWETKTIVIPASCECMWPVHRLGEMTLHV